MKFQNKEQTVVVWGCGYIGFSELIFFGKNGQKCIGVDVDDNLKQKILADEYKSDLIEWLQIDYKHLFETGIVDVISDKNLLPSTTLTHFVCIPTEKDGKPYLDILFSVIDNIIDIERKRKDSIVSVVIESTTVPGTAKKCLDHICEKLPNKIIYFSSSPRRDWFLEPEKNLSNLPRVIGSNSIDALEYHTNLIGQVCKNLVCASSFDTAELTKSIENSIRHVGITLANQLSDAFPNVDMREVLKLAGTKWNVNTYYPSFGTGGYCIPLSSEYLIEGAKTLCNTEIPILKEVVRFDKNRKNNIADDILPNVSNATVLFFGIAYKANTTVLKNSAALSMIKKLKERGHKVIVVDPSFTVDDVKEATESDVMSSSEITKEFLQSIDAIVYFTPHLSYYDDLVRIAKEIPPECQVYDGSELQNIEWNCEQHHLIGTPSWTSC